MESIQAGNSELKAVEELKAAIASYPHFPLALNELGVQYLKSGQLDKAADALKEAVRLSPYRKTSFPGSITESSC